MGCLYIILALISPRILLVVLWIFTEYVNQAFSHWIWPVLGLIFAPYLTLALTWAYLTEFGPLQIAAIVIGVCMDLASHGETERRRRRAPA
jgi:quinol-cytochrome oxidoreductase complex cytochrome b subunit